MSTKNTDDSKNGKGKGDKKKKAAVRFIKKKGVGALVIKLGRPEGMTTRRFHALLHDIANKCAIARNAGVTHWLMWRRANPDWKKGDPYVAPAPLIKVTPRKPKDPTKPRKPPTDGPLGPRLFISREISRVMNASVVGVSPSVISCCAQGWQDAFTNKTSYKDKERGYKGRWVWESILLNENSLPNYKNSEIIPVPKQQAKLFYTSDECKIRLPLLSKKSGWRIISPIVRLEVKGMSCGQRRILRNIADGTLARCDSQLTFARGEWYLNLTYKMPTVGSGLPKDRVLTVEPCGGDDPRPFRLYWTNEDDGEKRTWDVGAGRPLEAEYQRIQAKRRAIKGRPYKGKGCFVQSKRTRPMSDRVTNLCARFRKQTVSDIIKIAIRERCGTIIYREPTIPVRDYTWFAEHDVPMNWEPFTNQLIHRTIFVKGIDCEVVRIGKPEWYPKYGKKPKEQTTKKKAG